MATTVRVRPERTSSPAIRARPRWVGGALVAVVLVGAAFRLWGLGANRLGYDEAFTAMAGRLPLGSLFGYLRAHDSHPPLDYLLHLPLARLGVSAFWFRVPGVLCSIGALGLFAWWMRDRGRVGVLATAIMACSAFEIVHGRDARMYAELELIGVAVAVLAYAWLRAPRRRHAYLLGILVLLGLLTHVSMFLVGAGLLALPGLRRDREAWRWRSAIVAAGAGWAVLWGSSFLVQARGGHSDWIPRTTPGRVVDTVSSLVTKDTAFALVIVFAVAAGGVLLVRNDRWMGRVWCACFVVPLALATVAGLVAPVLLDRTLTMVAWAPMFAIAVVLDRLIRQRARARGRRGRFGRAAPAATVVHRARGEHRRGPRPAPPRSGGASRRRRGRARRGQGARGAVDARRARAPAVATGHVDRRAADGRRPAAGRRCADGADLDPRLELSGARRARVPTVRAGPSLRGQPHPLPAPRRRRMTVTPSS